MYIDTHTHLTFPEFEADLPQVIQKAKDANLSAIINIALDDEAIDKSLKIAEQYPGYVFNAAGMHPHDAKDWNQAYADRLKQLAKDKKIIAIGEMGLDYHFKLSPIEQRKEVFRQSLRIAQELDLPAIIHSREASKDTMMIIHEENQGNLKAVLHCFGSDMELAHEALELGLMISFTGTVTFKKAQPVRDAVSVIPLESLMIETDCPFLAPQTFRGKRNEPSYVVEVAKQIAAVKDLSLEEVAKITSNNAKTFFNL